LTPPSKGTERKGQTTDPKRKKKGNAKPHRQFRRGERKVVASRYALEKKMNKLEKCL